MSDEPANDNQPKTRKRGLKGVPLKVETTRTVVKTLVLKAGDIRKLLRLPADAKVTFAASTNEFAGGDGYVEASWSETR